MKKFITALLITACAPALAAELYINGILVEDAVVRITTAPPPPGPAPTPTPPPVDNSCSTDGLVCAYNITPEQWNSTQRTSSTITIPQGKTVVSRFTTSSDSSADYGRFSYTTPVSGVRQAADVWVSASAGGEPVNDRCLLERKAYAYILRTTAFASRYCVLAPDTVYYLHIKHTDASDPASKIIRELTTG